MVDQIRPRDLPPVSGGIVSPTAALIVDGGGQVQKATPIQMVDAAAPLASQAEAEAGSDNSKRMSPLRVKQAVAVAVTPLVPKADLAAASGASLMGIGNGATAADVLSKISVGYPLVPGTFLGDGTAAKFGFNFNYTGQSITTNEIGLNVTYQNAVTVGGGKTYGVAAFIYSYGAAISCANYGANVVTRLAGEVPGTPLELNVDNIGTASGSGVGETSLWTYPGWKTGLNIIAGGTAPSMAGLIITCVDADTPGTPLINYGIIFDLDSIRKASILDTSRADTSILIAGTKRIAIDISGAVTTSNIAVKMAAGQFLNWVVGGTPQQVIGVSGVNLQVGYGVAATLLGSNPLPGAPTFDVGSSSTRWRRGYFANLNTGSLQVYADNTAATAGGLSAGEFYRTSTGQVMVVF